MLTAGVSARWRSSASLNDLTASALGAMGLRGGSGGRDNSSAMASAEQYRYPIGNHGRWAARCALPGVCEPTEVANTRDRRLLPLLSHKKAVRAHLS